MDRAALKEKVKECINKEEAVQFLEALIRIPSENLQPTYAQELVEMKLLEMGFKIEKFPCEVDKIKQLTDFCGYPGNDEFHKDIINIVAVKEASEKNSFLIHAHIDTAQRSSVMPDFIPEERDGRLYGLGVADDKGGVAMMLLATQAVLKIAPQLKNKLILMSTIGKRGAIGTLTAFQKGYKADAAIYLHPAETGHGFHEIKNYSMGTLDFNIEVTGRPGVFRDEIDDSEISAINEGAKVIQLLQKWERERRQIHHFKEDTFAGMPNTKVNLLNAYSKNLLREDALTFIIQGRMCFGLEETVQQVFEELKAYLKEELKNDEWLNAHPPIVSLGEIKATPAYVSRDSRLVRTLENNITSVKKFDDFIYQYHGSSDIRMPIVYGKTPTVGIGPLCGGLSANGAKEWMDLQDYLDGIEIVADMIIDWCL